MLNTIHHNGVCKFCFAPLMGTFFKEEIMKLSKYLLNILILVVLSNTVQAAAIPTDLKSNNLPKKLPIHSNHLSHLNSVPWLQKKENNNIVYFLFAWPERIERYDLVSETWLSTIPLSGAPISFTVDNDALFVSFGDRTSRFNLNGLGETQLTTLNGQTLFTINQYLYIHNGSMITSINKSTGAVIDSQDYWNSMEGLDVAPSIGKLFARTINVGPSDILEVILNPDGTLGSQSDSSYHGDFLNATQTFVFPDELHVAENSGIIYDTTTLLYSGSLAGSFTDLDFYNNKPILLRDGVLYAYSEDNLETGQFTPTLMPDGITIYSDSIFAFSDGGHGLEVEKIPISQLMPLEPGLPVDPKSTSFYPDDVEIGSDETVYLLSRDQLSIFRWSVPQRDYLHAIPLVSEPEEMAYSSNNNKLYLTYSTGQITQIDLSQTPLEEIPFVNSPQNPCGLATAGEFIFVCDPSGQWDSHFTYNSAGNIVSQEDWNYYSQEYVWSGTNRKMYFFRDDTSPNDLLWEDIDLGGFIGTKMDSPYHSSEGIKHPIRVAPNGSVVVLGSGRVYNAFTLEHIDTLANEIEDAAWTNNFLVTLRSIPNSSQLQKWGATGEDKSQSLKGEPIGMFSTSEGLVVITYLFDWPVFSIWDQDLKLIYQMDTPIYGLYATNDSPTKLGDETTLSANLLDGKNVSYSWTFDDGEIGNGVIVSHTYQDSGEFIATVTASNNANISQAATKIKIFRIYQNYLPITLSVINPKSKH